MRRALLIPLSWLYAFGVALRHWLYDHHLLPSVGVRVPTICVGNLAVGGTGKTPMVEYLVRLLLSQGLHVAVLSRGYKRKTRGFRLASPVDTALTLGDEPMQIHARFPEVTVAVCESRVHGIHMLQRVIEKLDVVVLDDAMQHRSLRCGLTVLLTPYDRLYIDDHMLPWGTLRDLPSRALKVDMIVVTKCPSTMKPIDMRVTDNRMHLPTYQHLYFSGIRYASLEQQGRPLVVCAIAQPAYLMEHVRSLYPQAEALTFADHHPYTPKDIQTIVSRAKNYDFVLTTDKDYQRLRLTSLESQLRLLDLPLLTIPIEVHFIPDSQDFDRRILTYISENRRHPND